MSGVGSPLPQLLYLGDVPVEASYHGSALLHRLLGEWPAERLLIVEPGPYPSQLSRRLRGVSYRTLPFGIRRLLRSRFAHAYGSFVLITAKFRRRGLGKLLGTFEPDVVLTTTHGYSWVTAAAFAAEYGLPLHLVLHDDWLHGVRILSAMKPQAGRWFRQYYRQAASRFCVSPYMAEKYREMFGVDGTVLYPSRATDCPEWEKPPARISGTLSHPTVAFAGTINGSGYAGALRVLSDALVPLQGRLLIYGPLTQSQAQTIGLNRPHVILGGLVKSADLIARLRDEADILYVPMSFNKCDRVNMEVGFPSKMADYTAIGLPLLIHGPAYCSVVRWAGQNPGVAEVIDNEELSRVLGAVTRLARDSSLRQRLAAKAMDLGRKSFSYETTLRVFLNGLCHCKTERDACAPQISC